jgi:uncharacterized protein (DUF58 family)
MLLFLCLLLALCGFVARLFVPFVAALAACVALVAADAALGPSRRTLRVAREPVGHAALRRPSKVRYRVENRADLAIRLGLIETPVARIVFDRDVVEGRVAARSAATLESGFLARERGEARFGTLFYWVENGIGLLRRRYAVDSEEIVRVFPDLSAVEGYGRLARRSTLLDDGLRRLRLRGVGSEFESLRDYGPGDAFRDVDWKASARRGRLMVAQHEIERSQQVIVTLDCGRLMTPRIGLQSKFDYALTAALSVARIAQAAGDNVGLHAFGAKTVLSIAPRRGRAHVDALARSAYDLHPKLEEPDYESAFATLARRYAKRSLFVFFSDMFDPVTSAAVLSSLALLVPRHVVMCVLMNDAAIARALAVAPATAREAYRTSVAMTLDDERGRSIATLRSLGIIVVDVPAPELTVALLDAYLDVKARGLL